MEIEGHADLHKNLSGTVSGSKTVLVSENMGNSNSIFFAIELSCSGRVLLLYSDVLGHLRSGEILNTISI